MHYSDFSRFLTPFILIEKASIAAQHDHDGGSGGGAWWWSAPHRSGTT